MRKAIYRAKDDWVLGQCLECGKLNYVEPHGTTAQCSCNRITWTEHRNIPYEYRDASGNYLVHSLNPSDLAMARIADADKRARKPQQKETGNECG